MRRASLLLTVGVALAGCGGSGGLTKEQYAAKVSRLCVLAADQVRELHMGNSVSAWKSYGPQVVHIARHFDNALAALKAPSDIATDAAAYLKASENVLAADEAILETAQIGDPGPLQVALTVGDKYSRTSSLRAKKLGATGCYVP
jgi:hypothetical protein